MIDKTKLAARAPARAAKVPANDAVAAQETQFDDEMEERAELLREADAMRDMMLAQMKNDDETLKKYISMI